VFLNFARRFRGRRILLPCSAPNRFRHDGTIALQCDSSIIRPENRIVVRLRRSTHGRIVNIWLVLIVIVGAAIVIADGLTRGPILEREATWNEPFEYEPYLGAFLLAGMTFPLMVAYSRKAKIHLTEGVFLWFTLCTTAYTRDFSYLRWPGAPVFVTDVVLLVILFSTYILRRCEYRRNPLAVNFFLASFLAAGILSALIGFSKHRDVILIFRDSTIVAYVLFLFVARNLLKTWHSIKRAGVWFVAGTALATLNGLGWFIAVPKERRLIWYGIYILISLVGILLAIANDLIRPVVGWSLAGLLSTGLLLANTRSLFVSLGIMLLLGLLMGRIAFNRIRYARLATTVITAAAFAVFVSLPLFCAQVGRGLITRSVQGLASGVLHSETDVYWQYRLLAWKEAWSRFEKAPLTGEGFGVPFVFDLADVDVRPHNTFLTVLYKMGLIGFSPLLALLVCFFWHCLRAVRRNLNYKRVGWLQIMLLAQMAFCLYGSANLLLESPFLGSLFWASIGLTISIINLLDDERALRKSPQRALPKEPFYEPSRKLQQLDRSWSPTTVPNGPQPLKEDLA
jgi:O-antigen ligase